MVDSARVRRLLDLMASYRGQLESLAAAAPEEYVGERAYAGRYLVQATAQAAIDIANHVIASSGWRVPRELREAFTVLEEHKVIDPKLADQMRELAGLRNRLVHTYGDVDDSVVHASLAGDLDDLNQYAKAIAAFVERDGESG